MWKKWLPDRFTWMLLAAIALASFLPARGWAAPVFSHLTDVAIAMLFFLHGLKLSRREVLAGITHWRLHLLILGSTYVLFPLMGLAFRPLLEPLVTPDIYVGVVFLCMVSSAVQSSIAMTSMGRGNVSAAICSASGSNLLGVFVTPLLVAMLMSSGHHGVSWHAVGEVVLLLLLPFVIGLCGQRWLGGMVKQHPAVVSLFDQGSIVLIVYTAFSASVVAGLWQHTPLPVLGGLLAICALFLSVALVVTCLGARLLGFNKEDEITIVFCGSKKSLAAGAPMAKVLFASSAFGAMLLPVMIYNQMQIMVGAFIARHYAKRKTVRRTVQ
ncbi:MAG TPA: bile acid:sodium symporter family protein [Oleiagrimonas sp.]|nr:bile acid:sodium symporter family protein [Oleiagrimonas sp.]